MKPRFFNVALLLLPLTLLPCHGQAEEALTTVKPVQEPHPLHFKGIYGFSLTGLPVGKLGIELEQEPKHYSGAADIMTTGLVKLFVKHSSHTTVDCSGQQDFAYTECTYESHYQTKKKKKFVKMETHDGVTAHEQLVPPDNGRPLVPVTMKKDVADPISLVLRMREGLWRAKQRHEKQFTVRMYDGRRLTEVDFTIIDKLSYPYQGTRVPVTLVSVKRRQLAGFTPTEIADHDPHEPELRLYFTDDARMIPIRAEFTTLLGIASANLLKECLPSESCLLGNKE